MPRNVQHRLRDLARLLAVWVLHVVGSKSLSVFMVHCVVCIILHLVQKGPELDDTLGEQGSGARSDVGSHYSSLDIPFRKAMCAAMELLFFQ